MCICTTPLCIKDPLQQDHGDHADQQNLVLEFVGLGVGVENVLLVDFELAGFGVGDVLLAVAG